MEQKQVKAHAKNSEGEAWSNRLAFGVVGAGFLEFPFKVLQLVWYLCQKMGRSDKTLVAFKPP